MMKIAMSAAASSLLRALLSRAGVRRDRILLTDLRSTEWQSLTFVGERHEICLRVPGRDSQRVIDQLTAGIADAEFAIPGHIVADIVVVGSPQRSGDGSGTLRLEALTIAE